MDTKGSNIPAIERATGRSWADWVALIDAAGGRELPHPDIARVTHGVLDGVIDSSGWWAQGVAIAYEQHIGRRLPGQSPDGTFQASASRTLPDDPLAARARWITLLADDAALRAAGAGEARLTETPSG